MYSARILNRSFALIIIIPLSIWLTKFWNDLLHIKSMQKVSIAVDTCVYEDNGVCKLENLVMLCQTT